MIRRWEHLSQEHRGDFAVFAVREDRSRSPRTGLVHPFYVIESANWVNCLPITNDGKLVCIRQYRHGSRTVALEIPGGLIDEGEAPATAALRELREETGYTAQEIVHLGTMRPNPAIMNNMCHFYLGRQASRCHDQQLDVAEDIEVVLIDLDDIPRLIATGDLDHGISLAGLYYLDLHLRSHT